MAKKDAGIDPKMLELLVCPVTKGRLEKIAPIIDISQKNTTIKKPA